MSEASAKPAADVPPYRTPSPPATLTSRMPRQIRFIVGNEGAERFSFYGMRAILVIFMTKYLLMTEADSKGVFHLFVAFCYLFPLIGGFLADRFLGRYNTIFYLSFLYCAGHAALAVFEGTKWGLFLGLFLIALGSGAIKPCISAFVGDQFDKTNKHLLPKVYGLFYWMINFGSFFSTLLIPWTREKYGPAIAFGIPGILMAVATFVLWIGRKQYVRVPPTGANPNSFTRVVWSVLKTQPVRLMMAASFVMVVVLLIAITILGIVGVPTWLIQSVEWLTLCIAIGAVALTVVQALQKRPFLELAEGKFPKKDVEGANAALRVMKIFVWVSVFWALFDQHSGSWVLQAKAMTRRVWMGTVQDGTVLGWIAHALGNVKVPVKATDAPQTLFDLGGGAWRWDFTLAPDQIPALNPLMVMMIIPIVTAFLYPMAEKLGWRPTALRKMTVGMIVASASFLVVAGLQLPLDGGGSVHVLWQMIPFFVLTMAEVFVSVTGLEFAYTQAPRSMKSTMMSFWLLTVFLGNVIAGYLEKAEFFGPFGQFILFATMMGVIALVFGWQSRGYQVVDYIGDDEPDAPPSPALTPARAGLATAEHS